MFLSVEKWPVFEKWDGKCKVAIIPKNIIECMQANKQKLLVHSAKLLLWLKIQGRSGYIQFYKVNNALTSINQSETPLRTSRPSVIYSKWKATYQYPKLLGIIMRQIHQDIPPCRDIYGRQLVFKPRLTLIILNPKNRVHIAMMSSTTLPEI